MGPPDTWKRGFAFHTAVPSKESTVLWGIRARPLLSQWSGSPDALSVLLLGLVVRSVVLGLGRVCAKPTVPAGAGREKPR